jgi:hypothetical protein
MRRQQDAGFQVRFTLGPVLDDISIIWIPTNDTAKAVKIKDVDSPIDEIEARQENFLPLCAIKFEPPRGGRELEEMTICTPRSDEFKRLCPYFQDHWKGAKELPTEQREKGTPTRAAEPQSGTA